ncbi:uncharacterized protein PAC_00293 [Phialocephala subalpina]|uniref:TM2 domain-containing protein n=1 Tax=Phialocephala subalpina TaxID=576137 RepID=A0A1L7WCB5_9HELO|nr:uncharacterized protein PAC_00293 [Phialocephala subalpina]
MASYSKANSSHIVAMTSVEEYKDTKMEKSARQANTGSRLRHFVAKYTAHILSYQFIMLLLLCIISYHTGSHDQPSLTKRHWGYMTTTQTYNCYRQERTATLLALFLGLLGVDQFYAHHYVRAVFKMLTVGGMGLWAVIDIVLWIVGGIYSTPGCDIVWDGHYGNSTMRH